MTRFKYNPNVTHKFSFEIEDFGYGRARVIAIPNQEVIDFAVTLLPNDAELLNHISVASIDGYGTDEPTIDFWLVLPADIIEQVCRLARGKQAGEQAARIPLKNGVTLTASWSKLGLDISADGIIENAGGNSFFYIDGADDGETVVALWTDRTKEDYTYRLRLEDLMSTEDEEVHDDNDT